MSTLTQPGSMALRSLRRDYWKGLMLLFAFICAYSATELLLNVNRPYWGDEQHFIETVRQFGTGISLDTIRHYNEMSTPLPFVMYGIWARLFGFETQTIRLFSLVLASLTYIALYRLAFSVFNDSKIALLITGYVALNPYMLAFSIFVFTDMAAMLFLILVCLSVKDHNPALFLVSSAGALLCRQYLIFLPVAAAAYYLAMLVWSHGKERHNAILMLVAAAISLLPLLVLIGIWHGPNPDNTEQQLYVGETLRFHPNSLTLYVTLLCIYLLPVVLLTLRRFFADRWVWIIALAASWTYGFFPVQPSRVSVDANIDTVGIFHRVVKSVLGPQYEQWIFFLSFLAGSVIALVLVKDVSWRWWRRDLGLPLFLGLSILAFLVIMPFSYLGWEKYFLPAIPIMVIWMLATGGNVPTKEHDLLPKETVQDRAVISP